MTKCALKMIMATAEDRATAKVRRLEKERMEREAAERRWQKEKNKTMPIVNMILADFEKKFRDYEGKPQDFKMKICFDNYNLGDFSEYSSGVREYAICKSKYSDNRPSVCFIGDNYYNVKTIFRILKEMCYEVSKCNYYDSGFWYYGSGQVNCLSFVLSFNSECFEK